MKNWIPCSPFDKASRTMMTFILETCQDIKRYTDRRIFLGDRKGSAKPQWMLLNEWMNDYMRLHREVEDVPRYAMKDAMNEIMTNGIKKQPQFRRDYNVFSIEPRSGWKRELDESETEWKDYTNGKVKKEDGRVVNPTTAIERMYEDGFVAFRWGKVKMKGNYADILGSQVEKKNIQRDQFLRRVVTIDLSRLNDEDDWKINFNLE